MVLRFVFPWKRSDRKADPSQPVGRRWVSRYFPGLCLQWVLRVEAGPFVLSQQPKLQLLGGAESVFA